MHEYIPATNEIATAIANHQYTPPFDFITGRTDDYDLSCQEARVLFGVERRAGRTGKCTESICNMAKRFHLTERTVQKALKYLVEVANILERTERQGRTTEYRVRDQRQWAWLPMKSSERWTKRKRVRRPKARRAKRSHKVRVTKVRVTIHQQPTCFLAGGSFDTPGGGAIDTPPPPSIDTPPPGANDTPQRISSEEAPLNNLPLRRSEVEAHTPLLEEHSKPESEEVWTRERFRKSFEEELAKYAR